MIEDKSFYAFEKEDHIAWVTLDRADKRNAMGPAAWREIGPLFAAIEADQEVRVVVIKAAGPMFCAGIDLIGMAPEYRALRDWDLSASAHAELFHVVMQLQESITCVEKCSKPVICAIHGKCIGAGLDLASACDIRLATEDATLCLKETAVAFIADVGSLQRMPHIVGQGITREMAYTAEPMDAQRALAINLVNRVFADQDAMLAAARDMALKIAANAPLSVQGSKEVLNFGRGKTIADSLEYVAARSSMILPSDDMAETLTAFMEKRPPNFTGK